MPNAPSWGLDNRTVAVRVPTDSSDNVRLEHRVAGADANPYLMLAAILADVRARGDAAVLEYTARFDGLQAA